MATIEIKKGLLISTDELVNSVSGMEVSVLNLLLEQVQKTLIVHQNNTDRNQAQLLTEIKNILPPSVLRRYRQLRIKQQNGTIVSKEQDEMQLLSDILEEKMAERVVLLGELARLRNISLSELRKQVRLQDLYA